MLFVTGQANSHEGDGRYLGVLDDGGEKAVNVGREVDDVKVSGEEIEPGPAGQDVVRNLDIVVNFCFCYYCVYGHQPFTMWARRFRLMQGFACGQKVSDISSVVCC